MQKYEAEVQESNKKKLTNVQEKYGLPLKAYYL